jgi:hypothetical protein
VKFKVKLALISLVWVFLGTQATAGSAWREWCATNAPLWSGEMKPDRMACWVHEDVAGGGAEAATDSSAMNVEKCHAVTMKGCFQPAVADEGAQWFYMDASTEAKANPSPICADYDGNGVDCTVDKPSTGDCGNDGDDSGVAINNSKFYDATPADRFFWIDEIVAPGDGKTLFVSLVCR